MWEWCHDGEGAPEKRDGSNFSNEPSADRENGKAAKVFVDPVWYESDGLKYSRGGSYYDFPASVNARFRYPYQPDERARFIGFRLARTASGNDTK